MTHDADHDPEFEAFLKRRSPMHRRLSELDRAEIDMTEPSAETDRLVLNRARDAIGAPAREPMYRASRWAMPLGLAATILIAFTVLLNIDHRNAPAEALVATSAKPVAAAAPLAESAPADLAAQAQTAPPAAAPSAPALAKSAATEIAESSTNERKLAESASLTMAAAPVADAAERREQTESLALADSAAAEAESDLDTATSAAAGEAAGAGASGSGGLYSFRSDRAAASNSAPSAGPPLSASRTALPSSYTPPPPTPALATARANPEAWLREINRLRAAGKNEEADRELAAFREAYPSHPGYSVAKPPTR